MAVFEYNALTSMGRQMKGVIEAGTKTEAEQLLEGMQLTVNSVGKAKAEKPKTAISRNEFLLFNQQLASITKAGMPLERGLRELSKDIASKSMRKLIDGIADELEAGVSIERAFEKKQKHFPPLYGKILKAGVESGRLSEMLTSLNRHLEIAGHTRRIIFEAISYPLVILLLAMIVISFVLVFIIPQFVPIFEEIFGVDNLPDITKVFLFMSKEIVYVWMFFGIVILSVIALFSALSASAAGRRFKESLLLKIPVFGRLYRSSILSRMAEAMSMMVAAGCDMPSCLRLSANSTGSEKLILESDILAGQIEKGENILEAGQFCTVIPRLFLYSVQLGVQRNELQDNLQGLGQMYAEQARCRQAVLQSFLLPIMLILVGGFIAFAVLAMFLPMVKIITTLRV